MAISITNVVGGNVINDYGLDNVPYTVGTTGATTALLAFTGWDIAPSPYNSSGKAPAVNVTDSNGNLWRQIGISTVNTSSRCAVWIADNPGQVSWVSVALTGWGYSTSYMICEMDNIPSSMASIALDFVSWTINTAPTTTVTLNATATTSDIVLGVVANGGSTSAFNVPASWTGIAGFGGAAPSATTTWGNYIANQAAGAVPAFSPTWTGSAPTSAIIVGLKQTSTAPTQTNPNMPNVVVEAAFGASPGDYTESVDYTYDSTGLVWTDISSRVFSKGDEGKIQVKRGRQYELSQEETGELDIELDNHDGVFTYGNLASPYYSTALNTNMSFASGTTAPWVPSTGVTISAVTTPTFASGYQPFITAPFSCKVVSGSAANPSISNEFIAVNAGFQYTASAWAFAAAGWASGVSVGVNWYTSAFGFISSSAFSSTVLPAGVWTQTVESGVVAPATAAYAQLIVELGGTPGSGFTWNVAEAALNPGSSPVQTGCIVPETPIRVTAWYQGVQYPVGFGYVERWPQDWPDMPQWGFSSIVAVNAFGPMASTNLPSAVEGDIRISAPYAYFPTSEQYEFTSQSLTPTASPIDANGLIAANSAFGNNLYGAYRDGFDQPVTTGQALNLLGDQSTCLGATTYTGQEIETNGPGMFYFDPNIPTNANSAGFSVEFWFLWGNTNQFSCQLFSAFGRPSAFFAATPLTSPTTGGVISVGVNTGLTESTAVTSGFYVNGLEVTNGQFDQSGFEPQHFCLTAGPNGTQTYLNGSPTSTHPTMGVIPQIRAMCLGPARFSYDVSNLVVYNGYNFNAGHLAWYGQELTPTQIANHYESGFSGWVGVPAPGRFAQVLTWGGLGLKRGGTAWFQTYGQAEGTYMSEAYDTSGSSASDQVNEIVQTEGGRCYAQANGSVVYTYRWQGYNGATVATFGDNGTTQLPYEQTTSFAVDNQFIYNQVTATQNRGPNQDFFVSNNNFTSQTNYFLRSGLSYSSYSMLPFDVLDRVNWSLQKYQQPGERVIQLSVDVSRSTGKFANVLFPTILGMELNDIVSVARNPIGGGNIVLAGVVQSISHDIGATFWKTEMQVTPTFPDGNALFTDTAGFNTPNSNYLAW